MGYFDFIGDAFGSLGSALASIDPGPAIGNLGASLDKFVGTAIPGGWGMVGAIALTVLTMGAIDLEPEMMAGEVGAEVGTAGGTGVGLTSGAVDAALQEGLTSPFMSSLQSALMTAGKGALVGGLTSGTMSAIQGGDPLKAALKGALYGGITGGVLGGLTEAGVPDLLARALASVGTGAIQGQDLSTILQNSALSTGLGAIANQANAYVNPVVTNAGTGALGSAIKGGDPLTGALSGAIGSTIGQGVNAVKTELSGLSPSSSSPMFATAAPATTTPTDSHLLEFGGIGTISRSMANDYLTAASGEFADKLADTLPAISEQRAALIDQAEGIKADYTDIMDVQDQIKTLMTDSDYSNRYEALTKNQFELQKMYSQLTELNREFNSSKTMFERMYNNGLPNYSDPYHGVKGMYDDAVNAANQINNLLPQYQTLSDSFTTEHDALSAVYEQLQPLVKEFQTAQSELQDSVQSYATNNTDFTKLVDTASSYLSGLTDISSGKLPTDYMAAELALDSPFAKALNSEQLAELKQSQEAVINPVTQPTTTDTKTDTGELTVTADTGGTKDGTTSVTVTSPEDDFTGAEPITPQPVEEDLSHKVLESFSYGDTMTLEHMADGRWVVSDSNTGAVLGEINAPVAEEPTPVEPTPVEPTPVEPTPVEPTPVEPTPVEPTPAEPLPVEPTPVEPTPVEPAPVEPTPAPVEPTPAPVEPTPVEPTPVEPTPVEPTPVEPTPVEPTPVEPTPVVPEPIVPTPVEPTPVTDTVVPPVTDTTGTGTDTTGTGTDTTGTGTDTTGTGTDTGGPLAPFGAVDEDGNIMPGWSIDDNGEWVYDPSTLPTTEEPTTPTGGGTATGSGGTSTGTGGTKTPTSTGTGGTSTGTGTTKTPTSLPAMKAAIAAGSKITDLTPQLTKATPFKFANTPTFVDELTPMGNQTPFDYTSQIFNAASGGSTSTGKTITDLKPQLTSRTAFQFANNPVFSSPLTATAQTPPTDYTQQILNAATGGLVQGYAEGSGVGQVEGVEVLKPQVVRGRHVPAFFQGAQMAQTYTPRTYAEGGDVESHNPQFFSEGGLGTLQNTFVKGDGDGTSDSIPAMLANGEFVVPADVVSSLGNGSNDSGAQVLDEFLKVIRQHKRKADAQQLPPDSKGALGYLLEAKRKVG